MEIPLKKPIYNLPLRVETDGFFQALFTYYVYGFHYGILPAGMNGLAKQATPLMISAAHRVFLRPKRVIPCQAKMYDGASTKLTRMKFRYLLSVPASDTAFKDRP
jgi:hypothetical protein